MGWTSSWCFCVLSSNVTHLVLLFNPWTSASGLKSRAAAQTHCKAEPWHNQMSPGGLHKLIRGATTAAKSLQTHSNTHTYPDSDSVSTSFLSHWSPAVTWRQQDTYVDECVDRALWPDAWTPLFIVFRGTNVSPLKIQKLQGFSLH